MKRRPDESDLRRRGLRALVCGDGLVYGVELLVAVLDYRVHDIGLVHDDGLQKYRGHVYLPVVDARGRVRLFAARERDRGLGGLLREQVYGLVDGHRLLARDDALQRREVCVLTGDEHLAREVLDFERGDRAARRRVVRSDDGGHVARRLCERVLRDAQRLAREPVLRELIREDVYVAAVYRGLQDFHLPLAQQLRVVVRGRAADEYVVALRHALEEVVGLKLADLLVVERDVEVGLAVAYQPVVGDDGHALRLRRLDD